MGPHVLMTPMWTGPAASLQLSILVCGMILLTYLIQSNQAWNFDLQLFLVEILKAMYPSSKLQRRTLSLPMASQFL